jgi:hypothetical protein
MYDILPVLSNGFGIFGALLLVMVIVPVWTLFRQLPTVAT